MSFGREIHIEVEIMILHQRPFDFADIIETVLGERVFRFGQPKGVARVVVDRDSRISDPFDRPVGDVFHRAVDRRALHRRPAAGGQRDEGDNPRQTGDHMRTYLH